MQKHSKSTGARLLVLVSLLVAASVAVESLKSRLRLPKSAPTPSLGLDAPVLPPNLVRDPVFAATAPRPAAIVAPRPGAKGEALIALVAIGAYIGVLSMSLFGGESLPDLLSIRGDPDASPALAADVLGAQVGPPATAVAMLDATPTETPVAEQEPAPANVLTVDPAPERPAQHTLRSGETLTSVAALYGVTAYDLAVTNALTSDRILAGQVLKIPAR